jgi:hypothetical protein
MPSRTSSDSASYLGVAVNPGINFTEYWGKLEPTVDLFGKTAMNRLNNACVGLKHHGGLPLSADRRAVPGGSAELLHHGGAEGLQRRGSDTVDMADLVSQPEVSKLLREAQTHADIGDYMQAMAGRSLAFTALLDQYSGGLGAYDWDQTPFSFGPRFEGRDRARNCREIRSNGLSGSRRT